jgi:hypothetical protein
LEYPPEFTAKTAITFMEIYWNNGKAADGRVDKPFSPIRDCGSTGTMPLPPQSRAGPFFSEMQKSFSRWTKAFLTGLF